MPPFRDEDKFSPESVVEYFEIESYFQFSTPSSYLVAKQREEQQRSKKCACYHHRNVSSNI